MEEILRLVGVMSAVVGVPMMFIFAVPPLAKAFARKLEGDRASGDETLAELETLRAEVEELRELAPRLLELEERVDFTERLLARQAEPEQLAPARTDAERMP
jgi:hypothetical protein